MGIFGKLFSKKVDYPPIDPNSTAASRLAEVEPQIDELAHRVREPLEVIPSEHAAYVFIGKPPKKFGLAWIHDDKISGLNTLVEEHGLAPTAMARVVGQLREAYEHSADANRFCAKVKDRDVIVTDSPELEKEVHEIIGKVVHR